jgi:glycerol-3-phosphate acyltransferase PlsX
MLCVLIVDTIMGVQSVQNPKKSKEILKREGDLFRIGVDITGNDRNPLDLLPFISQVQNKLHPSIELQVYVPFELKDVVSLMSLPSKQLSILFVKEAIQMDESPLHAVRRKKASSIVLGTEAIAEKKLDAFVSAGNTGALIASSVLKIPLLKNIDRPALAVTLPTTQEPVLLLDVGANVTMSTSLYQQFARLGSAFYNAWFNTELPRVGLLNIGTERGKGTGALQEGYSSLQNLSTEGEIDFVGNIEPWQVFKGCVDVVVTDGFSGNIFLKASEGTSLFILDILQSFFKDFSSSQEIFTSIKEAVSHAAFPGALLLGLQGLIIKCHGDASSNSLVKSVLQAQTLLLSGLFNSLKELEF